MLQWRHLARFVLILVDITLEFVRRLEVENLVEAVPAWMDLQRVRQEDEDRDGKLPDGDEERRRWVHRDDVRADLARYVQNGKVVYTCAGNLRESRMSDNRRPR